MTMSDSEAFEAIRSHHRQLGAAVTKRVDALVGDVAGNRGYEIARAEFITFLVDEILPHAAAEELTIYPAASTLSDLAPTVTAMVAEHRQLAGLVESLAGASSADDAVADAQTLAALFSAHVAVENEVLLPALVADESVDVASLLSSMQHLTRPIPEDASEAPASTMGIESVLVTQLIAASTELARAGQAERACTILAGTWATLRSPRRELAEVVNRSLHRLVRLATQEPVTFTVKPAVVTDPAEAVLDVRPMAPAQRHHTIFATYESLGAGESFTLVNDHDPKPLQYQFEAEHAGAFTWDYAERGPRVWRVRIGRVA